MHPIVLFEACIVGFYATTIYFFVTNMIIGQAHVPTLMFIVGFTKHFLGFYVLHTLYCNKGSACKAINHDIEDRRYVATNSRRNLFMESILEGIVFASIVPPLLHVYGRFAYALVFFTGGCLHIGAELTGLHDTFCRTRCLALVGKMDKLDSKIT